MQAIFLAKHVKEDLPLALEISRDLASIYREDMPAWTLNMPSFIKLDLGDRDAAYQLSMEILTYGADKFDPAEIYFLTEYVCTRVLEKEKAIINPICVEFLNKIK